MIDIPRNELLEKLAAGWMVRRKSWYLGIFSHRDQDIGIGMDELVADDWEGKPSRRKSNLQGCTCLFAFEQLKNGASYIRRAEWTDDEGYVSGSEDIYISIEDLLATDWEIWS